MRYEIDLYRRTREPAPDLQERAPPTTAELRKEMREASDGLMFYALRRDSIAAVATHCATTMLQVARTLDERGETPDVPDLVDGCCALIVEGRDMMDRALLLQDGAQVRGAAVVMEITIRGILATLLGAVPYEALMDTIAHHADLHALLLACGALRPHSPPSETPS